MKKIDHIRVIIRFDPFLVYLTKEGEEEEKLYGGPFAWSESRICIDKKISKKKFLKLVEELGSEFASKYLEIAEKVKP